MPRSDRPGGSEKHGRGRPEKGLGKPGRPSGRRRPLQAPRGRGRQQIL